VQHEASQHAPHSTAIMAGGAIQASCATNMSLTLYKTHTNPLIAIISSHIEQQQHRANNTMVVTTQVVATGYTAEDGPHIAPAQ